MVQNERAVGVTLRTFLLTTAGAIGAAGLLGGFFVLVRGRANTSLALGYYILGSLIIIAGGFPTGGMSLLRGRMTKRRPGGSSGYAMPSFLLGIVLIAVGFLIDDYHPF